MHHCAKTPYTAYPLSKPESVEASNLAEVLLWLDEHLEAGNGSPGVCARVRGRPLTPNATTSCSTQPRRLPGSGFTGLVRCGLATDGCRDHFIRLAQ
jgi:hypothetical protein